MAFNTVSQTVSDPETASYGPQMATNAAQLSFGVARLLRESGEGPSAAAAAAAASGRSQAERPNPLINGTAPDPPSAYTDTSSPALLSSSPYLSWDTAGKNPSPARLQRQSAFTPVAPRRLPVTADKQDDSPTLPVPIATGRAPGWVCTSSHAAAHAGKFYIAADSTPIERV